MTPQRLPMLGEEAGTSLYSMEWLRQRVLWHLNPANCTGQVFLAEGADGCRVATPFPVQDSSMLTPLARADCLLIREPYAPPVGAGARCAILKLGQ